MTSFQGAIRIHLCIGIERINAVTFNSKIKVMKTQATNSDPIYYQDASKLAELIRTREISPVEVMKAHLDRIDSVNPTINAIVTIADNALAKQLKRQRRRL